MKYSYIPFYIFLIVLSIYGQNDVLDDYIQIGLAKNLALKQKEFSLKKSIAALDEARGMFLPSVEISARYSRAEGGRQIDLPIGDLMNPVYSGLNQLIGANVYPQISNQQIDFLRKKEHDTKISIVQPIFQPQIYFNYQIKSDLVEISRVEKKLFSRELIAEIKKAYYNYNKAVLAIEIYREAYELLEENLRVSKSLYENQKVTKDVVYRAEAELSELEQKKYENEKSKDLAKNYFNFLLNQPLDSEITIDNEINSQKNLVNSLEDLVANALAKREEFMQLTLAIEATDKSISLSNSTMLPSLLLAADYGYQGEEYKFTQDYDYWMASLVLKWNLFRGFQDKAKAEQSEHEKNILETKKVELQKNIVLQITNAYNDFLTTGKTLTTAELREKSASAAFEIVQKKYNEGMASQIEFMDARSTLTGARLNAILTVYDLLIMKAELEKLTVTDTVEKYLEKDNLEK